MINLYMVLEDDQNMGLNTVRAEWGVSQIPTTSRMFWDVIQTQFPGGKVASARYVPLVQMVTNLIVTFPCFGDGFTLAAEFCIVPFLLNLN